MLDIRPRKNTWYALGSKLVISKDIIWGSSYNILTGIVQECIGHMSLKYSKGLFSLFLTKNCSNVKSKVSERSWPFVRFPFVWGLRQQLAWSKIINLANVFAHRPGNLSRFRKHLSAIPASSKSAHFVSALLLSRQAWTLMPFAMPWFFVVSMRNGHFWNWYNNSNIIIHSVHPTVSGQNQNVTKCKYCSFIIVGMPCSLLVIPPSVSCPQVEVVGSMLVPARHTQECVLQYRSGWWHASLCLLCQAYPRVCPTPRPSPSFTH